MKCERCDRSSEKNDKFCRSCGEELPEEETFQCECGAEVCSGDKYCHKCGAMFSGNSCGCGFEIPQNAGYCPGCGEKVEKSEESEDIEEKSSPYSYTTESDVVQEDDGENNSTTYTVKESSPGEIDDLGLIDISKQ